MRERRTFWLNLVSPGPLAHFLEAGSITPVLASAELRGRTCTNSITDAMAGVMQSEYQSDREVWCDLILFLQEKGYNVALSSTESFDNGFAEIKSLGMMIEAIPSPLSIGSPVRISLLWSVDSGRPDPHASMRTALEIERFLVERAATCSRCSVNEVAGRYRLD